MVHGGRRSPAGRRDRRRSDERRRSKDKHHGSPDHYRSPERHRPKDRHKSPDRGRRKDDRRKDDRHHEKRKEKPPRMTRLLDYLRKPSPGPERRQAAPPPASAKAAPTDMDMKKSKAPLATYRDVRPPSLRKEPIAPVSPTAVSQKPAAPTPTPIVPTPVPIAAGPAPADANRMSQRSASRMGEKSAQGQSKMSQMSRGPNSPYTKYTTQTGAATAIGGRIPLRRIYLILAIGGSLVLVAAIIGLSVMLALGGPTGQTVYDKGCKKNYKKFANGCLAGSEPLQNCSVAGRCTKFEYAATKQQNPPIWKFGEKSDDDKASTSVKNLLCGTRDSLGVYTADGECDRSYTFSKAKRDDLFGNATWEDNCDEPNPCWNTIEPFEHQTVTRDDCRTGSTSKCQRGMHSVVWMQHLRCNLGPDRTTPEPCIGKSSVAIGLGSYIRLRLWMPMSAWSDEGLSQLHVQMRRNRRRDGVPERSTLPRRCGNRAPLQRPMLYRS